MLLPSPARSRKCGGSSAKRIRQSWPPQDRVGTTSGCRIFPLNPHAEKPGQSDAVLAFFSIELLTWRRDQFLHRYLEPYYESFCRLCARQVVMVKEESRLIQEEKDRVCDPNGVEMFRKHRTD